VSYALHRTVGLWAIDYGRNADLIMAEAMADEGFRTISLWTDSLPYCPGHYEEPWLWVTDEPGCRWERFLKSTRAKQIFIRFHAWQVVEGEGCRIHERAPHWFILNRLYEIAWNRNITIVFAPWEQDWYALGCAPCNADEGCCPEGGECSIEEKRRQYMERQDQLITFENRRQRDFEQARAAMIQRYPNASLNVLRAMVGNRHPWNRDKEPWAADLPTIADRVGEMRYPPDLFGVSYWEWGLDPAVVLDWYQETTNFPRHRIFIAEFGGRNTREEQAERFREYIPVFWNWGIRTALAWIYHEPTNSQWLLTDESLETIRYLNLEAITWPTN